MEVNTYQKKLKARVRDYWNAKPCGVKNSQFVIGTRAFFDDVERHRYTEEFHIPQVAEFDQHCSDRVLEIGGGLGTDGRQFACNGSWYLDADLSLSSLKLARTAFFAFDVAGRFVNADAEDLPFTANSFDVAYSHGVLHHTPDTEAALEEVHRVLRPGGRLIVMLYARESFTYAVGVHVAGRLRLERLRWQLGDAEFNRLLGLPPEYRGWLPTSKIVDNSTDGVGNPLSKFYSRRELNKLFAIYRGITIEKHYFPRRKVPFVGARLPIPVASWLGRTVGGYWYVKAYK